ncbi:hypothetical protein HT118_29840 [Escherichia coli]|nr:hypothetical protein [Escherichia coli]
MWRFIPRWRGNTTPDIFATVVTRFIPLARGTQKSNSACKWGSWFTPAGAGKHLRYFYLVSRGIGLSRWRGEHVFLSSHESR